MRLLLLILLVTSFLLLPARASNADALADALDKARSIYQHGEFRRAIRAYDKILDDNPADQEALRFRGLAHMALGQYKEGQQDFLSCSSDTDTDSCPQPPALGADPNEAGAQALYIKGCLALRNHDYDSADRYFKQALDLFPKYPECLNKLALALAAQDDYNDAIAVCIDALSYHPSDLKVWESLSLFCNNLGTFKCSTTAAKIALSLSPPMGDQESLMNLLASDRQEVGHPVSSLMQYFMQNGYGVGGIGGP